MTRHRARPSFTVEIKRTRNTPIITQQDEADRHRAAAEALWKGTALAEMTAKAESLDTVFAPAPPRPVAAPPHPRAAAPERRVLPSLIPAPEIEPALEADAPAAEPPVRRRRAPVPRPRTLTLVAQVEAPDAPLPEAQVVAAPEPVAASADLASVDGTRDPQRPGRAYAQRSKSTLRPGERWKRRLPRVCW